MRRSLPPIVQPTPHASHSDAAQVAWQCAHGWGPLSVQELTAAALQRAPATARPQEGKTSTAAALVACRCRPAAPAPSLLATAGQRALAVNGRGLCCSAAAAAAAAHGRPEASYYRRHRWRQRRCCSHRRCRCRRCCRGRAQRSCSRRRPSPLPFGRAAVAAARTHGAATYLATSYRQRLL